MKTWLVLFLAFCCLPVLGGDFDKSVPLQGLTSVRIAGDGPAERALRVELARSGIPMDESSAVILMVDLRVWKTEIYPGAGEFTMYTGQVRLLSEVTIKNTEVSWMTSIWDSQVYQGYLGSKIMTTPAETMAETIKKSLADEFASDWLKAQSALKARRRELAILVKNWCEENPNGGSVTGANGEPIVLTAQEVSERLRNANAELGIVPDPSPVVIQTVRE